jgi:hypothetical protein
MAKAVKFRPSPGSLASFETHHTHTDPKIVSYGTWARSSNLPIRPFDNAKEIYTKKPKIQLDKEREFGNHIIIKNRDKFTEMALIDYVPASEKVLK